MQQPKKYLKYQILKVTRIIDNLLHSDKDKDVDLGTSAQAQWMGSILFYFIVNHIMLHQKQVAFFFKFVIELNQLIETLLIISNLKVCEVKGLNEFNMKE